MNRIHLILTFCLFSVFMSCSKDDEASGDQGFNLEQPDAIDPVDYEIYSLIIKERYSANEIVVNQRSNNAIELNSPYGIDYYDNLMAENPGIEEGIIDDLRTVNNSYVVFGLEFVVDNKDINLLPFDESNHLFNQDEDFNAGWDEFYAKFPEANGILNFSSIGYNNSKTQALLEMTRYCGSLCGYVDVVYLEKENGIWVIKSIINLWVS